MTDAPPPPPGQLALMKRRLDQAKRDREEILAEARAKRDRSVAAGNPRLIRAGAEIAVLEKQLDRFDTGGHPERLAMGVADSRSPRDAQVLARGELDKAGDPVPRGVVQVLNKKNLRPRSRKAAVAPNWPGGSRHRKIR